MPRNDDTATLAGVDVLVTRPAHQAGGLCAMIGEAGGRVEQVPVIELAGAPDPQGLASLFERLADHALAIFVSANAVDRTLALLASRGGWPAGVPIATVGRGSAAALARHGLPVAICPPAPFNSEGLLAEPALQQVAGQRIIIFRGAGGRELMTDTLRARGAEVVHAEVYRRRIPPGAADALRAVASGPVEIVVVTSNEGLHNLYILAGEELRDWLLGRQLVVISERAATLAAELGFERPAEVANEASDPGLLAAIRRVTTRNNDHNEVSRHVQ